MRQSSLALGLVLALSLTLWGPSEAQFNRSLLSHEVRLSRSLQSARGSGFWSVKGTNFVDSAGRVVRFSGVMWSGFETPDAVVQGLWGRTIASHLDQMKSLGFNMIRLPFAGDTLRPGQKPTTNIYGHNPGLKGLNSIKIMDKVIEACGSRGIKVILDYHRIHLTINNEDGLWWDKTASEDVWVNNWVMLAKRYKGNPTIIGADLFNEVHPNPAKFPPGAPFWSYNAGANEKYNFRRACIRVINAMKAVEPNWIFFIEGMGNGYWWGGDVSAVLRAPITQPANKIAYSAHEYGPYVFMQKWFLDKNFPRNLVPLWSSKWGLTVEQKKGALWIGEFGSFYPKGSKNLKDRIETVAFEQLIAYIKKLNVPWTLAFWNPNSKDTGGILNNDWSTVNWSKMTALRTIMHPNFV